jgi:uncharacterized protein with FMN-binding domain
MRRSTAAAVGTLTGAALIIGVRLSVTPPAAPTASSSVADLSDATPADGSKKSPAASASGKKSPAKNHTGLKDGQFKGKGVPDPYGTVQVTIKVEGGEITAVGASYPLAGNSATINPVAIPKLKQATLQAQSAKVAAVSGATYTSAAYKESLQSALDSAKA